MLTAIDEEGYSPISLEISGPRSASSAATSIPTPEDAAGSRNMAGRDRWPVRGAGFVGGLAAGLLTIFVVPANLPFVVTLGAMILVGLGTAIQASRQATPSGAGAVIAGIIAIVLVLAGVSTGLQAVSAAPPEGTRAVLFRRGALALATAGLLTGLVAAGMSYFFWRRDRRHRRVD